MPRSKSKSDEDILESALALSTELGPDVLTFASLANRSGLATATLVQRFGTKAGLKQRTLLHGWDRLDTETAARAAAAPRTPEGAVRLLVGLSTLYGDLEAYAQMLRLLREDLRDPVVRARAAAWKNALVRTLDECFAKGRFPRGVGLMMAAQWQGAHLLWSFDPQQRVEEVVEDCLTRFISVLTRSGPDMPATPHAEGQHGKRSS